MSKEESISSATGLSEVSNHSLDGFEWIKHYTSGKRDIFFLGMTLMLGTQFIDPFDGGYVVLLTGLLFVGTGYAILTTSVAEMTSTLPFSGGIYGLVRAFTNPLYGFYIACFEMILNLFYVATFVHNLCLIPSDLGLSPPNWQLGYAVLVYLIILAITLFGVRSMFVSSTFLGSFVLVLLLIYTFGSIPNADFSQWGYGPKWDIKTALMVLPFRASNFLGMQFLPMTSPTARHPRTDVPIAMCMVMAMVLFTAIGTLTLGSAQYPGLPDLGLRNYPLQYGFSKIFNISTHTAIILYIPCYFASILGFSFGYGRQAYLMSRSGLLPQCFQWTLPVLDTPYVAFFVGCFLAFWINVVLYWKPSLMIEFYLVASLSSFIVYIAALWTYTDFQKKYSSLKRQFRSPFGVWGAYVGIAIFLVCIVGNVGFQKNNAFAVLFVVCASVVIVAYFFAVMRGKQKFSEEEKNELFQAYLINANQATKKQMKKNAMLRNHKVAPHSLATSGGASSFLSRSHHHNGLTIADRNSGHVTAPASPGSPSAPIPDLLLARVEEGIIENENGLPVPSQIPSSPSPNDQMKADETLAAEAPLPTQLEHFMHAVTNSVKSMRRTEGKESEEASAPMHQKSFSEKVLQFFQQKFNAVVPEQDPEIQGFNFIQQGGILSLSSNNNHENSHPTVDQVSIV